MGKTSKPLHIHVASELYNVNPIPWDALLEQGFVIDLIGNGEPPDIYLAPYAMRMTSTMLAEMPAALNLAIKGARVLRYGPTGILTKGKKDAQVKAPRPRKNSKVKAQVGGGGEPTVEAPSDSATGAIGGTTTEQQSSEAANTAGVSNDIFLE